MDEHIRSRDFYYLESLVERFKNESVMLLKENKRLEEALMRIMGNTEDFDSHTIWRICVDALYPSDAIVERKNDDSTLF